MFRDRRISRGLLDTFSLASDTLYSTQKGISSLQVPILRVPFETEDVDFIKSGISAILDSGMLTMGKHTSAFEKSFASFSNSTNAISCSNGTSALELILRGLGVEGKSVIVPTNTFMASAYAVMQSGNRVIFADCDPKTFSLDPHDVMKRVEGDTAAIMIVHIGGVISSEINELVQLCKSKGLYLIEDCAHAHGCEYDGQAAGTFGVAGAFSFFPTKVLTMGEGGAVTTNDDLLANRIRIIRNHGKNPDLGNRISYMAYNYRISEVTALLGEEQMLRAERIVSERQQIAAFYDEHVAKISGITPLSLPSSLRSSYYKYLCYLDDSIDRTVLKKTLKDQYHVSLTGEVYAELCHTEPLWDDFDMWGKHRQDPEAGKRIRGQSFPGSEQVAKYHVCLPVYPGLTNLELEHVSYALSKALSMKTD